MKIKRLILTVLLTLFLVGNVYAGEWCKPSAELAIDAAVTTSAGIFHGIIVFTDASNAVTLSIYDNATAASGAELIPTLIVTTSATDRIQSISISPAVRYYNGIYVDITCSGTVAYMVYFKSD